MLVIAIDFIRLITPRYKVTRFYYILVVVDYFSRFYWLLGYILPSLDMAVRILRDVIIPVFRLLEVIYSD